MAVPALNLPPSLQSIVFYIGVIGFPFAALLAWAFELTPDGIKREHEVDRSQSVTHVTGRKLDFVIIGLMAIALSFVVWDAYLREANEEVITEIPAAAIDPAAVEPTAASIAVLPFVNMSADKDQEFFSDGISEELLNLLARVPGLKVAGRTSSFAFKGKDTDLREIGSMLNVDNIVEGSVRKSANTLRITAQLINVEDGYHLWSDTYDRELTDVFAIQDEIAGAILDQLKAHLLKDGKVVLASTRTDSEVYDLYLLARQRIYARNQLSIEAAVALLDSAVGKDPKYAPAYAQRGIAYLLLSHYGTLSEQESQQLGKQDVDKALALDPNLAEGWAGLGLYHLGRPKEHQQAIEMLTKALSINPSLIDASLWLSSAYGNAGKHAETLPLLEGISARDPLYKPGIGNLVATYNVRGRQDESFALLKRVSPYFPNDPEMLHNQATILFSLGRYAEGLPLIEEAYQKRPEDDVFAMFLGVGLFSTHQYERMTQLSVPFFKFYAQKKLGKRNEATLLAQEQAAKGNIGPLFDLLGTVDGAEKLIQYLETRWADLDTFQTDYPHDFDGYPLMLQVAFAYRAIGNQERFKDAMTRVRTAHDRLLGEGFDHFLLYTNEANYYAMTGDHDKAIAKLDVAVSKGYIGDLRLADMNRPLMALEDDPRFQAIQRRMIENLNAQRAALGLEPAGL
ncbi:MAG: hypothetical protein V7700_14495 [Halioglobus sp.]